jgi:1-acyl-sn-glycerol-3-phosphate acyltransferase
MDKPLSSKLGRLPHAVARSIGFLAISVGAVADYAIRFRGAPLRRRALWQQYWGRRFAWLFGLEIEISGHIPRHGLIVANHLGYVDILVLSTITPCVFVSKAEVARWPVLGTLARIAGTIFIDRTRRSAVAGVNAQVEAATRAGLSVVLFPEGTSSDGRTVLPFKASLLEPSCRAGCPLTPAALSYRLDAGSVATDVCYWGEMTLLPHLFRLFQQRQVYARVVFGKTFEQAASRKELAAALREHVSNLRTSSAEEPALAITKI